MDEFLPVRRKKTKTPLHVHKPILIEPSNKAVEQTATDTPVVPEPPEEKIEQADIRPPHTPEMIVSKKPFYKRMHLIKRFKALSKKKKVMVIILALLLLGGGSVGAWALFKPAPKASSKAVAVEPPKPAPKSETEPSRLTGVQVKPELNQRPVTAIMIENSPDARPQSGLKDAGVVFEAIAEGGITRFLTLFQEGQPDDIGPVRSVRPYFIDWAHGFDAAIAHVGGSSDGLSKMKAEGIKDLDQFSNPAPYHRISSRYAPHNMYTSMAGLDELSKSKGFTSSKFDGFPRKDEQPAKPAVITSLDFNISGYLYNPHFDYDATTNSYKRSEGGKPHIDAKSGEQLAPKVVISAVMGYGIAANGVNSTYDNIGSGKVVIFQDGGKTEGTWNKSNGDSQITFKDMDGKVIKLNAGQTWISVVGSGDRIVVK